MIERKKRDALLTGYFEKNEEVLIPARNLVAELQAKDKLERENVLLRAKIMALKERLAIKNIDLMLAELDRPVYRRFEVRA